MQIYQVGGAVRDALLGLEIKERDWVVVGSSQAEMLANGFRQVGKDFPVFLHPDTHEEYALARTERKSGKGYKGFEMFADPDVSLEEDLRRRDLTINAMAQDEDGTLIDPYGGQRDLEARLLRHVSEAFVEDPLRVLRIARFAARFDSLGFVIAEQTRALMKEIVRAAEMEALTPERVWLETQKALQTSRPQIYFQVLRECGALQILFPEINALFGVPQPEEHHPEIDSGVHTMMVLEQAARLSDDVAVRFAALTHDLGKGETPEEEWPKHHGHEKRSARLIMNLCARLRIPNAVRDIAALVGEFHFHCHRAFELRPASLLELMESLSIFRKPERIEQFVLACTADSLGRTGYEDSDYPQGRFFRDAAQACCEVSAKPFVEQGLQGEQIALAMRRKRQQTIAAVKRRYAPQMEE